MGMNTANLCKMIDSAIQDEADAVEMYGTISKGMIDNSLIIAVPTVNSIKGDEQRHKQLLIQIKSHIC